MKEYHKDPYVLRWSIENGYAERNRDGWFCRWLCRSGHSIDVRDCGVANDRRTWEDQQLNGGKRLQTVTDQDRDGVAESPPGSRWLRVIFREYSVLLRGDVRYFGVMLDSSPTFRRHISEASRKAAKATTTLGRLMPYIESLSRAKYIIIITATISKTL